MTRFTMQTARHLAAEAYNYDVEVEKSSQMKNSLLTGKERALLRALHRAEAIYDEWLEIEGQRRKDQAADGALGAEAPSLLIKLQELQQIWNRIGIASTELLCLASDWQSINEIDRFKAEFGRSLSVLIAGCEIAVEQCEAHLGRPVGSATVPLLEFTKELRAFWLAETNAPFSYQRNSADLEQGQTVFVGAAARLLFAAAQVLDPGHTESMVRRAMEQAQRSPDPC